MHVHVSFFHFVFLRRHFPVCAGISSSMSATVCVHAILAICLRIRRARCFFLWHPLQSIISLLIILITTTSIIVLLFAIAASPVLPPSLTSSHITSFYYLHHHSALGDTAALAKTQASSASAMEVEQEEEVEGAGISASVIATMESTAKKCSKGRRKRCKALAAVVNAQPLSSYTVGSSNNLHKASAPGVTSLALKDDLILSGGVDATAIIYNKETGKIQDTLKQHKKKVTDVAFHPTSDLSTCITTSADNSAVVWSKNSASAKKLSAQYTFTHHSDEVVGCTLHPSNQYLVTASKDKTWAFYDITSGVLKEQVAESKIESAYSRVCFHPDGLILGCGTEDAMIRIFDIKKPTNQKIAATLEGHKGKITGLSFSENGYYLASGDDNGVVKVWDLRYLSEVKTLTNTKVSTIGNVCFDTSGALLGVGGNDGVTTFYNSKTWDVVSEYKEHTDVVTDLVYERELNYFVSSSLDRSIKIWTA